MKKFTDEIYTEKVVFFSEILSLCRAAEIHVSIYQYMFHVSLTKIKRSIFIKLLEID